MAHTLVTEDVWKYGRAPAEDWRLYPGRRCGFSYLLRRSSIHSLSVIAPLGRSQVEVDRVTMPLDEYLASVKAPLCGARYPLVLSDPCGTVAQQRVLRLRELPVFLGTMRHWHAVYSGLTHANAQVLTYAPWQNHVTDTVIVLADAGQLRAIGESLGRSAGIHHLVELPGAVTVVDGGPELSATYTFVPEPAKGVVVSDGAPVPIVARGQEQVRRSGDALETALLPELTALRPLPPDALPPKTFDGLAQIGTKNSPIALTDMRGKSD